MDLNKEIKLSDLFRRPKKRPKAATGKSSSKKRPKRQEIVGLKIGASQLVASRVLNNGGPGARLVQLASQPLEPGVVVGGEVRDVLALAQALDHFFTREKLPRRGIRLGVGTNRIGVRALDVEGIEDERQLENAIRFRAHEALSIPIDEAVLDYHVVNESVDAGSGTTSRRVVLAAAYREPIDHFVEACRGAKLELLGIDIEAFALLRALSPATKPDSNGRPVAVVALALGHDRSTLAISDGQVCDFTRVLDWGGAKIDAAISRDLGLTIEEANELKHGLSLEADAETESDPLRTRARAAVQRELQAIARDVIASLQFYQGQPGSLAISEILVTGGTTRMPGLLTELERLVRVPVKQANPLAALQTTPEISHRDDLASSAVAIGLGVEV
jgi:type IV pilus assembly protein PilM